MISVMNAGRGAGKTHALIKWAKGSPDRFIVGTHQATGDAMEQAGLSTQFIHFNGAKDFFRGRTNYEVAIDDLNWVFNGMLAERFGIDPEDNTTILAMNYPESDLLDSGSFPLDAINHSIEFMESLKTVLTGFKK